MSLSKITSLVETRLSEALSQSVQITSARSVGGGCINNAMKIDTNSGLYFLKWNDSGPVDLFLREAEGINVLRNANTNLHIPEVFIATEIQQNDPGILIMEYLPVININSVIQDNQLGEGLAQLHKITNSCYGFENNNFCGETIQDNSWNSDWVDFFGQQRIWHLIKLIEKKRGIHKKEIRLYQKLVERLPSIISHQPAASLNHGDLWSGNYLYTQNGPALIDPACYYADRECDLALMAMLGGFSETVWNVYQENYPLEDGWRDRRPLYQLYHYLNHYYLFGGHYGNQSLSIAKSYAG